VEPRAPKKFADLVINNQWGRYFRLLPGASDQSGFEKYVEAYHPVDIQKLSSAFGVACLSVDSPIELDNALVELLQTSQGPALLEIVTPKLSNPVVYKYFVSNMKCDIHNVK
jgi:2-succinyl-5-enolpyruvyl-6-hydroxy-3-cyclohexene-1-carboxylate synthase